MAAACFTADLGFPFLFTSANWTSTDWRLEAFIKAISGTVWARVWNITDSVEVITVSTASASYVRLRSVTFTLTDGKEYSGQFGVDAGATGRGTSLRLINI